MGFLLGLFPIQVGLCGGWWSIAFSFSNKKLKRTLTETDSDYDTETPFPRFIIIESAEEPITNFSPFIIEKVILSDLTPITLKNLKTKPC